MPSEEKLTYIGYREGVDPRTLSLGSLVFDFANPRTKEPYIHEKLTPDDLALWTVEDQRTNCWARYSSGKGCTLGGGVLNLAELKVSHDQTDCTVVVGSSGSKIEFLKPKEFFEKVILQSDAARFWLGSRLAVSKKLKYYYGLKLQHPSIWLLTGLYLMKDATCLNIFNTGSGFGAAITTPLPDPSGIAAALQLNPNLKWKTNSGLFVGGGSTFVGDRVWAAQYHRVGAKYTDIRDGVELSLTQVKLLDVFDMRASRGESSAVEVEVDDSPSSVDDEAAVLDEYDESYWQKFSEEVEDIEAELA